MANATRCPVCNRFGTVELDGFCRSCYVNPNSKNHFAQIKIYSRTDPTVVKGVLLEVGVERVADIKDIDISRVYNMIIRRLPPKKRGNIVKDASPMQEFGYDFKHETKKYDVEKEVCGYERSE